MTKIYLAGPLFTSPEQSWNTEVSNQLKQIGFETFLPQDECSGIQEEIFKTCIRGVNESDVILANVDGTDADSGTCFEIGYAYGLKKKIYLYRTDFRKCGDDGFCNLMLSKACEQLFKIESIEELISEMNRLYMEWKI